MRWLSITFVLVTFLAHVTLCAHPKFLRIHNQELEATSEANTAPQVEKNNLASTEGGAQLANLVAKKIKKLTKDIFKHAKTEYDRRNLMNQLKVIITDIAQKNNFSSADIRMCTKLIMEGINFALVSIGIPKPERRSNNSPEKTIKSTLPEITPVTRRSLKKRPTETVNKSVVTKKVVQHTSQCHGECPCLVQDVCERINILKTLKCHLDGSIVALQHLCDGEVNCVDGSDERNCEEQVNTRIETTECILNTLQNYIKFDKCFQMHNESLLEVLRSQRAGLKIVKEAFASEKIANQGAVVINLIAIALEESFCSPQIVMKNKGIQVKKRSWCAGACLCNQGSCKEAGCDRGCQASCLHRHMLRRWQCAAADGSKSVPLDALCDGVPDCTDETDEKNCFNGTSIAKFEAIKTLNEVIVQIKSRINSNEYFPATYQLQHLIEKIEQLRPTSDKKQVPEKRDKVIKALTKVYSIMGEEMTSLSKENEVYKFLNSINFGVLESVKRQTQVKKRTEGCQCSGSSCALGKCPRACARQCAVAERFRMFTCSGSKVPLTALCNVTRECKDGNDERYCVKGFCQKYHFMMLKTNIDAILKKHERTEIGKILSPWAIKVKETVDSRLKSGRANHKLLMAVVNETIDELVKTYAALGDRRSSSEQTLLKAMEAASRKIMLTLKLCAN